MNTRYMSNDALTTELPSFSTVPHDREAAIDDVFGILLLLGSVLPRSTELAHIDLVWVPSKDDTVDRIISRVSANEKMAAKESIRVTGGAVVKMRIFSKKQKDSRVG